MLSFKQVFIIIFYFSALIARDRIAVVTKVIGSVQIYREKDVSRKIKKGQIIESGDKLKTSKGSFAAIIFIDDKSALKIKENTEVIIFGKKASRSIGKKINLTNGSIRAQINKTGNRDFIVQTSVSVASVKGTDFWLVSDRNIGDSVIGIEGVVQLSNKLSGEKLDIISGTTGLSTKDGMLQSFYTDPKTIPIDLSGDELKNKKIEIEFKDDVGTKKTLIINYK